MNMQGKAGIVTGSGRGIGREVALLLAREGASVVVNDPGFGRGGEETEEKPADAVVAEIEAFQGKASANYSSVSDYASVGRMVAQCVDTYGKIDFVVNVAGMLRERMIWNMTEDDFDQVVSVHLKGHWNMCHHAIKVMRGARYGRIVNFSSDAFKGSVGQCNYSAAKAGIIGLSRSIAKEAYKFGITCNAICPSADTRMTLTPEVKANRERKLKSGLMTQEQYDRQTQPRGPEFVAPFVVYLAMDEAYYFNGQTIHSEKGRIHNYYFGEEMNKMYKDSENGMFSIEEIKQKAPGIFKGKMTEVTPAVEPAQAQKYVSQR